MKKLILLNLLFVVILNSNAQSSKILTHENIGWYNYFGTFNLNNKFSLHTEYQWRRNDFISNWQQSLMRIGLNYKYSSFTTYRIGAAWIETFPYGDISINKFDKDFTEFRIYQLLQLTSNQGFFNISHRYITEQRWVGKYNNEESKSEDSYQLMYRARYMLKVNVPLKGKEIIDKTPYLGFFDEIFIGFGKNVQNNIFDQNRIGLVLGYNFNKKLKLELGYINQTIQFGRRINNNNVIQINNGTILNLIVNI
jgi:hypothetical protein